MHDFSNLLQDYFKSNFFYLQGPYPSENADSSPSYLLCFSYPHNDYHGDTSTENINYLIPDHFYHPDPVKKWTLLWSVWYFHQQHIDVCLSHINNFPTNMTFRQHLTRVSLWDNPLYPSQDPFLFRDSVDAIMNGDLIVPCDTIC